MRLRPAFIRREVMAAFYRRPTPLGNCGPIVSFTFDDFPRTAYTAGGAILESVRARGTYYTAVGLMNSSNELGEQFRPDDLRGLVEKGHEVASHTFNHLSCNAVSSSLFQADVNKGRDALAEITGVQPENFAYPFGDLTLEAKKKVGPTLLSSRGIFPGLNGPEIDLNLLKANSLYGGRENSPRAEELIAENVRRRSWLIFYTHDVQPQPSPYGCTPELLQSAVSVAAQSGSRILTVQDALAEVGVAGSDITGLDTKGQVCLPESSRS